MARRFGLAWRVSAFALLTLATAYVLVAAASRGAADQPFCAREMRLEGACG